jgi:hypothetical protein
MREIMRAARKSDGQRHHIDFAETTLAISVNDETKMI